MYIENSLLLKLQETAAISALVGTRIYYVKAPQDVTCPYIVINKVSKVPQLTLTGVSSGVICRIQINVFDTTYKSCQDIVAAIKTAIHCATGVFGTGGVYVQGCFYDNETDLEHDTDDRLYGIAVDYMISYSE